MNNTLRAKKVCKAAPIAGETKVMRVYIHSCVCIYTFAPIYMCVCVCVFYEQHSACEESR